MVTSRRPAKHYLFNELAISREREQPLKSKWGSQGSIQNWEPIADRGHENSLLHTGDLVVASMWSLWQGSVYSGEVPQAILAERLSLKSPTFLGCASTSQLESGLPHSRV